MTTMTTAPETSPRARTHDRGGRSYADSPENPVLLRVGAASLVLGFVSQVPLGLLHPHEKQPNDSVGAFAEYAHADDWVLVHLGQFACALLVTLGLVVIATSLARQRGLPGALAVIAALTAVTTTAVFAVQMAVDGIALKAAVDAWFSASGGADQSAAFRVAEGIRATEKGLSALFHLNNGLTLISLGLAVALGSLYPRWLGWVGATVGASLLVLAVLTAQTGFSQEATSIALPASALLAVFVIGMSVALWRRATRHNENPE
jgi:uncharacterized membrane protein